jgi:hypothetical protein
MDLEELPTAVRPAEGEGDGPRIIRDGVLFAGQPFEAAIDLQHAGVVGQHLLSGDISEGPPSDMKRSEAFEDLFPDG